MYMSKYQLLQIYLSNFGRTAQTIVVMINSAANGDFDVIGAHSEGCSQGFLGLRDSHRCATRTLRFGGRSRDRHRFELQPMQVNAECLEGFVRHRVTALLPDVRTLKGGIFG